MTQSEIEEHLFINLDIGPQGQKMPACGPAKKKSYSALPGKHAKKTAVKKTVYIPSSNLIKVNYQ